MLECFHQHTICWLWNAENKFPSTLILFKLLPIVKHISSQVAGEKARDIYMDLLPKMTVMSRPTVQRREVQTVEEGANKLNRIY